MPHIEIKCFPGRSDEQKTLCAEKVAQAAAEAMGRDLSSVSVGIGGDKRGRKGKLEKGRLGQADSPG